MLVDFIVLKMAAVLVVITGNTCCFYILRYRKLPRSSLKVFFFFFFPLTLLFVFPKMYENDIVILLFE